MPTESLYERSLVDRDALSGVIPGRSLLVRVSLAPGNTPAGLAPLVISPISPVNIHIFVLAGPVTLTARICLMRLVSFKPCVRRLPMTRPIFFATSFTDGACFVT